MCARETPPAAALRNPLRPALSPPPGCVGFLAAAGDAGLARICHEHCGGRAAKAGLLTGTEAVQRAQRGASCLGRRLAAAMRSRAFWVAFVVFAIMLVVVAMMALR